MSLPCCVRTNHESQSSYTGFLLRGGRGMPFLLQALFGTLARISENPSFPFLSTDYGIPKLLRSLRRINSAVFDLNGRGRIRKCIL
jgi:hypothetical protein